jgi:hypothetical protein
MSSASDWPSTSSIVRKWARRPDRRLFGRQRLERDVASELGVMYAIHLAHPAGAEEREQLVVIETGADGERQVLWIIEGTEM